MCIDFGTSNTTVGSYGVYDEDQNNVEVVDFEDHTGDTVAYRKMLPTIIYVDKIERKDKGGLTLPILLATMPCKKSWTMTMIR